MSITIWKIRKTCLKISNNIFQIFLTVFPYYKNPQTTKKHSKWLPYLPMVYYIIKDYPVEQWKQVKKYKLSNSIPQDNTTWRKEQYWKGGCNSFEILISYRLDSSNNSRSEVTYSWRPLMYTQPAKKHVLLSSTINILILCNESFLDYSAYCHPLQLKVNFKTQCHFIVYYETNRAEEWKWI